MKISSIQVVLCLWALWSMAFVSQASAKSAEEQSYTVLPGDTLESIADRFEVDVEKILQRNRVSAFGLQPGSVLVLNTAVPVPRRARGYYRVREGDTPAAITKMFSMTEEHLRWVNPGLEIPVKLIPGDVLEVWRDVTHIRHGININGSIFRSRFKEPMWFPPGAGYVVKNEMTVWGRRPFIETLRQCLQELDRLFPQRPGVIVGDWSRKHGGTFPPHLSHKIGIDVDIGYPTIAPIDEKPRRFVLVDGKTMDVERTWALIRLLLQTRTIEYIFVEHRHQRILRSYAMDQGVAEDALTEIFQYPRLKGVRRGIIRHERGHRDHMHIRFGNTRKYISNETLEALLDEEDVGEIYGNDS